MLYVGQNRTSIEPMGEIEKRHPSLIFTERDRKLSHLAIKEAEVEGTVDFERLFRLFDQEKIGKSYQASVLLDHLIEAAGVEAFTVEVEEEYFKNCERDNAGLVPGYDQRHGAFVAGRMHFKDEQQLIH